MNQIAQKDKDSSVKVGNLELANDLPFTLIAGPCQIESRSHAFEMAERISTACSAAGIGYIYKSSFDKANRSSHNSPRGVGMLKGLDILADVKQTFGCPILTDVHSPEQCEPTANVADVLQIPAFLCRQTDLLLSAAATKAAINVKKGQFLAPNDTKNILEKIRSADNHRVMLTERGSSFGYNTLINDFRALPIMARFGCPVVYDATHSVQCPGSKGGSSGGEREFVPYLAAAAVAVGCAAIFIETHEDPDTAPSDGSTMLPVSELEALLRKLRRIETAASEPSTL